MNIERSYSSFVGKFWNWYKTRYPQPTSNEQIFWPLCFQVHKIKTCLRYEGKNNLVAQNSPTARRLSLSRTHLLPADSHCSELTYCPQTLIVQTSGPAGEEVGGGGHTSPRTASSYKTSGTWLKLLYTEIQCRAQWSVLCALKTLALYYSCDPGDFIQILRMI
jgi:hypothetical protein